VLNISFYCLSWAEAQLSKSDHIFLLGVLLHEISRWKFLADLQLWRQTIVGSTFPWTKHRVFEDFYSLRRFLESVGALMIDSLAVRKTIQHLQLQ
jgi:hypothetical protein